MTKRFTVVGDGAMGTACAMLLAENPEHEVTLWSAFPEYAAVLQEKRENVRFLPGARIPDRVRLTSDFASARDVDAFVLAVPTIYLSATLERLKPVWPAHAPAISVIKGVEQGTLRRPSEIIHDIVQPAAIAALTGPSHAEEISRRMPASVVAASEDVAFAVEAQQAFNTDRFRVYTTHDILGAELGGALKNVIAIAAGICDGLGFGDNAKSALMTRGLVEMVRFGVAMGAESETFYGLAGLGDLITTSVSRHGRNRRVGEQLGLGRKLRDILADTPQVAEGVWTARSVHDLADRLGIDMPVTGEVYRILYEDKEPLRAVADLMARDPKPER